jgi:hypothetical protein
MDHYLYIYKHACIEISEAVSDKFNIVKICCIRLFTEVGPQIV